MPSSARPHGAARDLALAGALALTSAAALVLPGTPLPFAALVLGVAGVLVLGIERCVTIALLTAFSLMPFVDSRAEVAGVPVWVPAYGVAFGLMGLSWIWRSTDAGRRATGRPNLVVILIAANLVWAVVRLVLSDPLSVPSVTAGFLAFPAAAAITYLWLSHPEASERARRAVPIVAVVAGLWALAYIGGATGTCGGCLSWIKVYSLRDVGGLLGADSRVYANGAQAFLVLVIVVFGLMLRRRSPALVVLTALGLLCVVLQGFRAQYVALLAGLLVLVAWRLRGMRVAGRVAIAACCIVAIGGFLLSPAGDRALSAYDELRLGSGTAGFRMSLILEARGAWTVAGQGVTGSAFPRGVIYDLGIPNTITALGYLGAALQLALLAAALARGLRARTLAGAIVAAVATMALVGRPTLALIEWGPSAAAFGIVLGVAAALAVRRRDEAPPGEDDGSGDHSLIDDGDLEELLAPAGAPPAR